MPIVFCVARRCNHRQHCLSSVLPIVFGIPVVASNAHNVSSIALCWCCPSSLVLPVVETIVSIAHRLWYYPSSIVLPIALQVLPNVNNIVLRCYCSLSSVLSVTATIVSITLCQYCPSSSVLPIVNSIAHRCKYRVHLRAGSEEPVRGAVGLLEMPAVRRAAWLASSPTSGGSTSASRGATAASERRTLSINFWFVAEWCALGR